MVVVYWDVGIVWCVFDILVVIVYDCVVSLVGWLFVSRWIVGGNFLYIWVGDCGCDYWVLLVVLLEVIFCGFLELVFDIVMMNIVVNVLG